MRNITLVILGTLVFLGCDSKNPSASKTSSGSDRMLMGEGSATSDGLSVTNGNVILKEGNPGIAFALATILGRAKEFTYFIVFNHEFPNGGVATQSGGDEFNAKSSHTIQAFGNECKVEYRVELNRDTKSVDFESTLIAGPSYDPSNGKLFLIDMKTTPPTVTQLNLKLPAEIPDLEKPEAAEKFGESTLNELRKTDKSVESFCKQIEQNGD